MELFVLLAAYLLGSIPFGLVLIKLSGLGDIRNVGSGNIGATNVLRTGRKGLALATLLLDGGKGTLAVLLAGKFNPDWMALAAGAVILGHLYPVWLRFKGGKGVATGIGVWLALDWRIGAGMIALWLLTFRITRISSLSALTAYALSVPLAVFLTPRLWVWAAFIAALIFLRHRANIQRLYRGEEPRFGDPKP